MPRARIYRPAKTAMQSGKAKTGKWVLEFEPTDPISPDALMGWAGSGDTRQQVKMRFDTMDEATSFAEANSIDADVIKPHEAKIIKKSYSDRFAFNRIR
ncbi:MAG: ETC complex I subunit [Rhodospirillaceae bacterium]|nr:ETC complex I subunit [Rhodospirillaceae bacterium]